jgi:hypothetical protein
MKNEGAYHVQKKRNHRLFAKFRPEIAGFYDNEAKNMNPISYNTKDLIDIKEN